MYKRIYFGDGKCLEYSIKNGVEELFDAYDKDYRYINERKSLNLKGEDLQSFAERYKDRAIVKTEEEYRDNGDIIEIVKEFKNNKLISQSNYKYQFKDKDKETYKLESMQRWDYDKEGKLTDEIESFILYDRWGIHIPNRVLYITRNYKIDENNQRQLTCEYKRTDNHEFAELVGKEDEFRDGLIHSNKSWKIGENGPVLERDEVTFSLPDVRIERVNGVEVQLGRTSNIEQPRRRLKCKDITIEMPNERRNDYSCTYFTKEGDEILGDEKLKIEFGLSCGEWYYIKEGSDFVRTDEQGIERKYSINKKIKDYIISLRSAYEFHIATDAYKYFENTDFQVLTEKHPDGTYREFNDDGVLVLETLADGTSRKWDDKGKIIEENLPDGTNSTWKYSRGDAVKTTVKGNETSTYINDEYTGKNVVDGNITRYYNKEDILVKEIDKEEMTEKYFYKNGNLRKEIFNKWEGHWQRGIKAKHYAPNGELAATENNLGMIQTYSSQKENLYSMYKKAIAENDQERAKEAVILMCKGLASVETLFHSTQNSICVRNDNIRSKIIDLGNGKVIFGCLLEDRDWVGKTMGYSGTEWRWKTQALIVDVENCGLVARCTGATTSVRDATSSKRDIWNKIDEDASCFTIEDGVLYTGLKAEDRYGGQWYEKSEGIKLDEVIDQYDKSRAEMIKEITLNKIQKYKESQQSANISSYVKDKIGMLKAVLRDNVSDKPGTVKPKRSPADKAVIRATIKEALGHDKE